MPTLPGIEFKFDIQRSKGVFLGYRRPAYVKPLAQGEPCHFPDTWRGIGLVLPYKETINQSEFDIVCRSNTVDQRHRCERIQKVSPFVERFKRRNILLIDARYVAVGNAGLDQMDKRLPRSTRGVGALQGRSFQVGLQVEEVTPGRRRLVALPIVKGFVYAACDGEAEPWRPAQGEDEVGEKVEALYRMILK